MDIFSEIISKAKESVNNETKFVDALYNELKDKPFEVKILFLYRLYNTNNSEYDCSQLVLALLKKGDSDLVRAQLVLESLRGYSVELIANYESFISLQKLKNNEKNGDGITQLLADYLKGKKLRKVKKTCKDDLIYFLKNIDKIADALFAEDSIPPIRIIIEVIFLSGNLSLKEINAIFNNVLLKNKALENFDYSEIIYKNMYLPCDIKGLIRKVPDDFYDKLLSELVPEEGNKAFSFNRFHAFFRYVNRVMAINADDKVAVDLFLNELDKRIPSGSKLKEAFHKKFSFSDIDMTEIVDKILAGENVEFDDLLLVKLAENEKFQENSDKIMASIIGNNPQKGKLALSFAASLIEKLKKQYGLDFKLVFESKIVNNKTLGYYNRENNVMYINRLFFENDAVDFDTKFLLAVNTIFHEVRHANQHREMEQSKEFNFDNLMMVMDLILSHNSSLSPYYKDNYEYISYENDAREFAFADTMKFFNGYDQLQEKFTTIYKDKIKSDHEVIRSELYRDEFGNKFGRHSDILSLFITLVDSKLENEDTREKMLDTLNKYPVIKQFFDFTATEIRLKPEEYFKSKISEVEAMPKGYEKKMAAYSLASFWRLKKIHLAQKNAFVNNKNEVVQKREEFAEEVRKFAGDMPKKPTR